MPSSEVYATVAQFKDHTEIPAATVKYDAAIGRLLASASRVIDAYCNAQDGFIAPATVTNRRFVGRGQPTLRIDECVAITSVAVKDSPTDTGFTVWAATDWVAFCGAAKTPVYNVLPYTGIAVTAAGDYGAFLSGRLGRRHFVETVRVTARWGRYAVIADIPQIRDVAIMQAMRWYKRMQSNMADTLASGDFGTLAFMQTIDPDIAMILIKGRQVRPVVA